MTREYIIFDPVADVDVLVIGGGVVGLACALATSRDGASVALVDPHPRFGSESSTHNSGVIHGGLYYPAGSLKARLCVEGRERLYEYCARRGIAHARCGKLVVAITESEIPELERLAARGAANGMSDLRMLSAADARRREPAIACAAALLSPSSGILSSEELVRALAHDCFSQDVALLPATKAIAAEPVGDGISISTPSERIVARTVVNAAGLFADEVSEMLGGEHFRIYPCRGEYAELTAKWRGRLSGPVYPLPDPSGHSLGIHITPTTWGSMLLGPTARWQERKDDYESDRLAIEWFLEPARLLLPEMTLSDIQPGGTGIRPKLHPPEEQFADFLIRRDARQPRLIQASGIDSPGLTACLAIGERVGEMVKDT